MTRSTFLIFSTCILSAAAFTIPKPREIRLSAVPLNVGIALDWDSNGDEALLMKRAYDCAHSDSCSLAEARASLDDVIHIQSGCASGDLLGSGVCENADNVAEIVGTLRKKIEIESQRVMVINTGVNLVSVSMTAVLLAIFVAGSAQVNPDSVAFTPQEWWWAARDGYLPTMFDHLFRNGGFAAIDFDAETAPFTWQEWWWAARDGYLPSMLHQLYQNGGLAVVDYDAEETTFTLREWIWAAQGGYLDRMVSHYYRNGGL